MKYAITTLGCKVNQFETQAMETMLSSLGYTSTKDGDADVIIVNTCAVTAESGRKSRQALRRLKGENPDALVAVCGCFSQISPEKMEELGADIIYGSGDRKMLVEDIHRIMQCREQVRHVDDPFQRRVFETLPAGAMDGRTRAYIKIQDGCDNFCTYCVIPYARGRVRSMPVSEAAAQARELAEQGFAEIVVTGIEIASYGKDLRDGSCLAGVVAAVADAAPGARIRLGSIEPTVVTDAFCQELAQRGNICRHFHLSLQSGCDRTLKNMHRKYDTKRFYEAVELLRQYFPGCALTADLITGFPGETEQDHADTLAFLQRCAFVSMHVFPYSQRPGTKAAAMEGQLTHAVKDARAREAQRLAKAMEQEYLQSCVGQILPVLFETENENYWHGHADNYCEVKAKGEDLRGLVRNVQIVAVEGNKLWGNII